MGEVEGNLVKMRLIRIARGYIQKEDEDLVGE